MKKIILLVAIIGIVSTCSAKDLSQESKDMAGRIVEALGYQCSKVDNATKFIGGDISVYCDGYSYGYVIKNVGGRFVVTSK